MAKLPTRDSLGEAPSGRSGRAIATYDTTAIGRGVQAFGHGIASLGDSLGALAETNDKAAEYETERRFQEFKFQNENDLDKLKQDMQPGQAGNFAEAWQGGYMKSGKEFLSTVPEKLKSKYDLRLFEVERGGYREAATFGRNEQKRASIADLQDFNNLYAPKPGNLDAGKADFDKRVELNPFLSPIEKEEQRRKGYSNLEETHAKWRAQQDDPHAVRRDLGLDPDLDTDANPEARAKPMSGTAAETAPVVDPAQRLLAAVEKVESGGRADVVSKAGAIGLMQVMPDTAREIAAEIDPEAANLKDDELKAYLKDPEVSRKYGAHYLEKQIARYGGDTEAALIAYNGGPKRADAWLAAGRDDKVIPKETADYYKKVKAELGGGEQPAQNGGKPVSFADYARGGKGAKTGYDAAAEQGINPRFNRGGALGLDGTDLATVKTQSGAKFTVARQAAGQVQGFLNELETAGYKIKPESSGGYNDRNIGGSNRKSQHAYGAAIDINWDENKFDSKGTNTLPPEVGKLADKWGLSWGGYFQGSKKDTMHFEVSRLMEGQQQPGQGAPASAGTRVASLSGKASDTYTGPYQNLSPEQRMSIAHAAETRIKQEVALVGQAVKAFDDIAEKGYAPEAGQLDALRTKVESTRDPRLAQEFNEASVIMQWQDKARQATPQELDAYIRGETERVRAQGATTFDTRRLSMADKLLTNMRTELKTDQLGWADRVGVEKLEPIDFSSPDAATASISKRIDQADRVAGRYGLEPQYLRPDERQKFTKALEAGGDRTVAAMSMVSVAAGDRARLIFGEAFKDAPTAAIIGNSVAEIGVPTSAVRDAADGMALAKEPGFQALATTKDYKPIANTMIGSALGGMPQVQTATVNAANLIYEVRARKQGIVDFDEGLWKQGMNELLGEREIKGEKYGGIVDSDTSFWGSGTRQIILPPFVKQDSWRGIMDAISHEDLAAAGLSQPVDKNGRAIPMSKIRNATLVQAGSGRYALTFGDPYGVDSADGGVLMRSDAPDQPFELDLRALRPLLAKRRPDLFIAEGN